MSGRNAVQRAYDRFGKEAGFEKKSGSWYRHGDEVISGSNLQKSQYGSQYYFNQGFWLRQLDDELFPKDYKCHIYVRLEHLLPAESDRIKHLLDFEYEMPDEQRIEKLVGLLRDDLLPLIEQGSSVAGLRTLVDEGKLGVEVLRVPAQQVLGAVSTN